MDIFVVDAFTTEAFRGNPAGVCILAEDRPDTWKQGLARELNHPETAFLRPLREGYELRWFTPTVEVPLCGHATLAGAHILSEFRGLSGPIHFHTRFSGTLTATTDAEGISLDFPALLTEPPEEHADAGALACISAVLGSEAVEIVVHRGSGERFYLARLSDPDAVRSLKVDTRALLAEGVGQLIVTAVADPGPYDFISRFFAPGFGIDEDPVTGAAHCVLAPYWSTILGAREFLGYQASARGGEVGCEFTGGRVRLIGKAVTVLRAELFPENNPKR
ncbi:MAG: PhzF family phenazine biosynthesis protein [Spirochaetota bacterium]